MKEHPQLEEELVDLYPNLAALSLNPPPPTPPLQEGEKFFYLFHRYRDSSREHARGAQRILASGGVGGHAGRPRGERSDNETGIDDIIANVTAFSLNERRRHALMSGSMKSDVNWFYLNWHQRLPVLTKASADELVFRVPESWLRRNALSCVEWLPNGKHRVEATGRTTAWALLTTLVVPLQFHVTSTTPLPREAELAMSNDEVAAIVYGAHTQADATSRDEDRYNKQ
jgi:hypothetical protein